jgi:hypothetical protein
MNSARLRAGTCSAGTTTTLGRSHMALIQAKSLSGSKGRLANSIGLMTTLCMLTVPMV